MRIVNILENDNNKVVNKEPFKQKSIQLDHSDKVTMDVPLLLKIMEFSREDARSDMDLHHMTEKLIALSQTNQILTMDHYQKIISSLTEMGGSEAEELVKAVSHDAPKSFEYDYKIKKFILKLPNGLAVARYKIFNPQGMPATDNVFKDYSSAVKHLRTFFNKEIKESYGRYWCSTDKRWKDRKGPKQPRK